MGEGEVDLFVFLITPASVRQGAYTLTELRNARERWAHPREHVLPVQLEPTLPEIPAYLRGVTIFEPEGNAAAEVAAHLTRRRLEAQGRRLRWTSFLSEANRRPSCASAWYRLCS